MTLTNNFTCRLKTWQKRPMYEMESIIGFLCQEAGL